MKCSFCHSEIEKGTEKIYVTKRGDVFYFCSGKCEKNQLKLGRKARKVKWTEEYRKEKKARLILHTEKKAKKKVGAGEKKKEAGKKPDAGGKKKEETGKKPEARGKKKKAGKREGKASTTKKKTAKKETKDRK